MKRLFLVLNIVIFLVLLIPAPVSACTYTYGAIPPYYALGYLFLLSIVLRTEPRLWGAGVVSFFIGLVSLLSLLIWNARNFPEESLFAIILCALLLFIAYMIIEIKNEKEITPAIIDTNFLTFMALISTFFCIVLLLIHRPYFSSRLTDILMGIATIALISSLLAFKEAARRHLARESRNTPFFRIVERFLFKPACYGISLALSVFLMIYNEKLEYKPYHLIFFAVTIITCIDLYNT